MGIKIVAVEELDVNSVVRAPIRTSMKRKSICGIEENTCVRERYSDYSEFLFLSICKSLHNKIRFFKDMVVTNLP